MAGELDVPQHVLRFWEGKFAQVKPMKRGGGRRYYRPQDIELLRGIRHLLYGEGYTIRGVQKILRDHGVRHVVQAGTGGSPSVASAPQLTPDDIAAAAQAANLSAEQVRVLQAALFELTEMKKVLDEAET